MNKVRIGIIGCGSIARLRHAPEYAKHSKTEIISFFDRNTERAKELARLFGGKVSASIEEIIQDPAIDAISDCTSNEMHPIVTSSALRSGKHVLCEKPIANTLEGAKKILMAQKESGKILMCAHNQRLTASHQKAKQLIKNGELGRILTFKTTFGHKGPETWSASKGRNTWFFDPQRSFFGVGGDLGIHKIDLIRYLLEDEIENIQSFQTTLDKKYESGEPIQVADNMICMIKMKGGSIGTAAFSWTYYGQEDNSTIIYGEKGVLKIYTDPEFSLLFEKRDGTTEQFRLDVMQTNDQQTNSGVINEFIECILQQKAPVATGEDGY
ncbi:Gfo/Idh/MocA family oxidoreductase, partial [Bacillaceae bacterium Marseille-Q3522]|nr:Gfo/Idh/MocA family oxidoreductase [Bacillaceae bacterium Marseille-Q3522]